MFQGVADDAGFSAGRRLAENAGTVGYASLHAAMQAVIHGQRITLASLILGKSRSAATEAIEPVAASVETMHEAIVDQTNAVCNGYGVCLPLVFPTPRSGMWPMGASTYMVIAGRDPKAGVNASNADAARLCAARWRLLSFLKWSIQSHDARNIKQSEYFASARPSARLDILQQLSALKCGGELRQQSGELPANGEVTVLKYAHFPGAEHHASEALLVALENFYALNVDNVLSFEKVAIEDSRAPAQAVLGSLRAGALAFAISDSMTCVPHESICLCLFLICFPHETVVRPNAQLLFSSWTKAELPPLCVQAPEAAERRDAQG